jgi:hypothetical protein
MKQPCHNTGKIKIGEFYQPPAPQPDQDMERLQLALLDDKAETDWERVMVWLGLILLVAFLLLDGAGLMPGGHRG